MRVYNALLDTELVDLLQSGDKCAFSELFYRYNRLLFVHAHKFLKDKEEAKDIVQEVFASVWANRGTSNLKPNFAGFLYTCIRNKVFDKHLHKNVKEKYLQSIRGFIHQGVAQADYLVRSRQLEAIIEREVSFLPEKMREIFELSRKQHLTHKEIAEQLNISEKTVKNQVNNALKVLRVKLGIFIYIYLIIHL